MNSIVLNNYVFFHKTESVDNLGRGTVQGLCRVK